MKIFSYQQLYDFAFQVFLAKGFTTENAKTATNVLLSADLRGIDSHGLARLNGYLRLLESGRANPNPKIITERETLGTATLDGDKGLGLITGPFAMKLAIEKAKEAGTGWVAVNNSNHFGIAGYYTLMAVEKDMIGIAMTNASPLVAPTYANERMLGTNPISFAAPAQNEPPLVMDMATTTAANGKLEILQRKQLPTPSGWVQDQNGYSVTDAFAVEKGGALLPLGGDYEHGSHKGYCLGSMVDILTAVLSGANFGPWVPPFVAFLNPGTQQVGKGIGHFFGAIRIDAFRPIEDFKTNLDIWIQRFRKAKPINPEQKVLVPGDPERENEIKRLKEGIPLLPPVVEKLKEISEKTGVKL